MARLGVRRSSRLFIAGVIIGLVLLASWWVIESGDRPLRETVVTQEAALGAGVGALGVDEQEAASAVGRLAVERTPVTVSIADEASEDLSAADEALEAGALEVYVDVAGIPADSGVVLVQRIPSNDAAEAFDLRATVQAPIEGGLARFGNLPRGVLLVGVRVGQGPEHRALWVNSLVQGGQLNFEMGQAQVHGAVRTNDGAAAVGARVRLTWSQGGPSGGERTIVAHTAAYGSYDAGSRVPVGRIRVRVDEHEGATGFPEREVRISSGAAYEVSFGPGSDLARLTGRVYAADGQLLTAADGRRADALRLVGRDGLGHEIEVPIRDGLIDLWLEPGLYAVEGAAEEREREPRSAFPNSAPDDRRRLNLNANLDADLVLEGFVLTGRLEGAANGEMRLRSEKPRSGSSLRASIHTDGTFRFVGLQAQRYVLEGERTEPLTIEIRAGDPIVVEVGVLVEERTDSLQPPKWGG